MLYIKYIYVSILLRGLLRGWGVGRGRRMKSQSFIGMLLWVSCNCIHQAYYLLYIFRQPKINKNRNAKVSSEIALGKKTMHIETNQPICTVNQVTGFYTVRTFSKRNFRTNYSIYTECKIQFYHSISPGWEHAFQWRSYVPLYCV